MQVDHTLSSDEFWARYAQFEDRMRGSFDAAPVLQIAGWPGERLLGEWDYEGAARAVVHRRGDREITVRTSDGEPEWAVRQQWLHTMLSGSGGSRDLSRFALQPPVPAAIRVDDREAHAQLWQSAQHWHLSLRHDGYTVLASGDEEFPALLALERITDLEPLLAARRREVEAKRRSTGLD
ncbi:hypothetical protein [Naasia aerilata]|uniref:Uncharacterized protein n=1 Tax=Naasia aerilata TaxID=1162966 RepID=A0ABM8GGG5_9MICO|nr:hypothetical protein [Naasia aerilata]BDZ47434.1 hypothetical protein GCM10025866_33430 [Naasia aerilata]